MSGVDLFRQRTTLVSILISLGIAVVGILLLVFANSSDLLSEHQNWQAIVRQLGSLLIASVAINVIWQLSGKRAFLSEIMAMAKVAEEIRVAGIIVVTNDFMRGINWPSLLDSVKKLDIFFAYGRTWRGANDTKLQALARQPGVRVRIILPDPNDPHVVAELARRFKKNPDELKREIENAKDDFIRIFGLSTHTDLSIWYLAAVPVYSFYRLDRNAILSLYKYKDGRGDIPTFMVEEGGTLFQFIHDELYTFIGDKGIAKRVYPTS